MTTSLLPSGAEVPFSEVESALIGSGDRAVGAPRMALTATIVAAGPADRLSEASQALGNLKDVGVRAVLISYGDRSAPTARVWHQTVALEGLQPRYLNNAVAALRLSSLPTLVWWRGGEVRNLEGLATLADRLVLDAEDPHEVWALVPKLAQRTAVSDLRWACLTRWRALMAHFFDIPDIRAAAPRFRSLKIEGGDRNAGALFAGWIVSSLNAQQRINAKVLETPGAPPIQTVVLGEGDEQLMLRLAANRTCVETASRLNGVVPACRIAALGNQDLASLIGEELRIRSRDLAFERAVAASRGLA